MEVCCLLPEDVIQTEPPTEEPEPADDPSVIDNVEDIMDDIDEREFATVPVDSETEGDSEATSSGGAGSGSSSFFVCGIANKANVQLKVSGDSDGKSITSN